MVADQSSEFAGNSSTLSRYINAVDLGCVPWVAVDTE